jgi:hypothetical protein
MLKYALLAGAMMLSAPAVAQDKPATPQTPAATQPAPTQTDPAQPVTPAPQAATPAQDSTSMTTATDPAAQPQAQAATAQPMTKAQQIAQVVDTEFATYDADKNGVLSATEFDAWMVALKTAADPTTKADAPATKKWLTLAFTQADTNKSKSVSKTELNGFLVAGNS